LLPRPSPGAQEEQQQVEKACECFSVTWETSLPVLQEVDTVLADDVGPEARMIQPGTSDLWKQRIFLNRTSVTEYASNIFGEPVRRDACCDLCVACLWLSQ
ncbi:hypothetical protein STEG23_031551, partial [Scotinomys teguina]